MRVEYLLGTITEIATFNEAFVEMELFNRNVSAIVVGISPKLNLSEKDETVQF